MLEIGDNSHYTGLSLKDDFIHYSCYLYQKSSTNTSDVRGHGHAAGNVSTFFNSKSGNCLARRLSAVSVAKTHPKVFGYAYSN